MVCTACCSALDNIITYLYKQAQMKGKPKRRHLSGVDDEPAVLKMVTMNPGVFQTMLQTVLNILMFEECRNQWSMSRPLLGLILLNESVSQKASSVLRRFVSQAIKFMGY
jgi:exportin-7